MTTPLVVVGAGGHGRELLDVVDACNNTGYGRQFDLLGVVDDSPSDLNLKRLADRGVSHLGGLGSWAAGGDRDVRYVIGIGSGAVRRVVDDLLTELGYQPAVLAHPAAVMGHGVDLAPGVVALAGAVLATNIRVGRHTHIHRCATVGHDCTLGEFVTVNPTASVSGDCVVEDHVMLGVGSVILQGLTVHRAATVGASACVVRDVEADTVVTGVPAQARPPRHDSARDSGESPRKDIPSTTPVAVPSLAQVGVGNGVANMFGGSTSMTVVGVTSIQRTRIIDKPWGFEEIFALVQGKYCGKLLHVRAGHSLSLQYHVAKDEFVSVQKGTALVEYGDRPESLDSVQLDEREGLHIPPGRIHRITAVTDLVMLEASTTELDDVVRLADNYGRTDTAVLPGQNRVPSQAVPADGRTA